MSNGTFKGWDESSIQEEKTVGSNIVVKGGSDQFMKLANVNGSTGNTQVISRQTGIYIANIIPFAEIRTRDSEGVVNVRSSPGTSSNIEGSVSNGQKVTVRSSEIGPDGYLWHKILSPAGYVRGDYLFYYSHSPSPITLMINRAITVPNITQGTEVKISGIINSDYNITDVSVGIYSDINGGKCYFSIKNAQPNLSSYNISSLDTSIEFSKLEVGTYYFEVTAIDEKIGRTKILVNRPFTVSSDTSTLSTNATPYPTQTGFSNSPLVVYTKISPNSTNPRADTIKKITIHHMAGNLTIERCGEVFQHTVEGERASANYGIGTDGRVGLYVEEKNRAWTSSNRVNDNQAVTIEVANNKGEPNWEVSDTAIDKLIDLCVDICKRNGISKLNYTGDSSGNLTRHNMFTATTCPGPYLQSKFGYIADEVNKRL